ncbi:FtsW/RodA/SpoVE family cell cycle protein [Mesobacillus foraminis]|uniref:FtsW/RodA/SpoVE family cell cycle protein n=1 Tax=Mesobacillus foraminis TaxID=279826 RepID=UPI000EF548AD|nr:FtsW/RodA/SpoVE family cell cycle protein [Mesobacillus foraminis]
MGYTLLKRLDKSVLTIICTLCILSILFIYSSQGTGQYGDQNFAMKQGVSYIIGFILLMAVAYLDADQFERIAWPFFLVCFASIVLLPLMPAAVAPSILGAKRWYSLPLLGSIQPSEFLKIALLLLTSRLAHKHNLLYQVRTVWTDLLLIGKVLLATIIPSIFVYQQPDTGMVVLYLAGSVTVLFLSGIQKKILAAVAIIPATAAAILVYVYFQFSSVFYDQLVPLLKPHQQERILGWLSPNEYADQAYQTKKAMLAVGSGELKGNGIGNGTVYIPEKHTDFIFATIAEEGGFIAAAAVLSLFFLLMYRMAIIGDSAESPFGLYICSGAMAMYALQIFQNIGMTIGVMPVKGISLPLLSYGGSSLLSNMIFLGIILSIRKPYRKFMFEANK